MHIAVYMFSFVNTMLAKFDIEAWLLTQAKITKTLVTKTRELASEMSCIIIVLDIELHPQHGLPYTVSLYTFK